jgi:divalent metal cation (Fe/Co/Zn/Cd) transporter
MMIAQLRSLLGKSASPTVLQTLTYVARNHHPDVLAIDTVRAYHYGYNYLVELDIVLPRDMPLHEAHDIGESLQNKLEALDKVERAFVHLDYETSHSPEHKPSSRRQSEANLVQITIPDETKEKGSLVVDNDNSVMV